MPQQFPEYCKVSPYTSFKKSTPTSHTEKQASNIKLLKVSVHLDEYQQL